MGSLHRKLRRNVLSPRIYPATSTPLPDCGWWWVEKGGSFVLDVCKSHSYALCSDAGDTAAENSNVFPIWVYLFFVLFRNLHWIQILRKKYNIIYYCINFNKNYCECSLINSLYVLILHTYYTSNEKYTLYCLESLTYTKLCFAPSSLKEILSMTMNYHECSLLSENEIINLNIENHPLSNRFRSTVNSIVAHEYKLVRLIMIVILKNKFISKYNN